MLYSCGSNLQNSHAEGASFPCLPTTIPTTTWLSLFKHQAFENAEKSLAEGRPIFDDVEVCEIRAPGLKDVKVFPATACHPLG